ncbi:MAG: M81 family metallopeptidase [Proteobacteria bacterium]|nr:M81 family metallopeptidase [Pseudomonadota bacterium]
MRLFTACLVHESSGFSPIPTSLQNFRDGLLHRPSRGELVPLRLTAIECGLTTKGTARGHDIVESVGAAATPSGPLNKADYELLRDEIVSDLKKAMPVDAIGLFLHGAQLAEGYDDCEGDLLASLRAVAGPDIPIGVEFDLHGNITPQMMANSTVIIGCKEYPHIDFSERADELLDILEAAAAKRIRPVSAWRKLPMLGIFHTTRQPLRGLVDRISALEKTPGVLTITIAHGFPWADTPHAGSAIIVTTDNDEALAARLCDEIARAFFAMRNEIAAPLTTLDEAFSLVSSGGNGLTVIADTADNAGGGAASDSTYFLHELVKRRIENAAIGMIWDPMAVKFAFDAGVGATLPLRIGGKISPLSGVPFDAEVTVTALNPALWQTAFGYRQPLGQAAAVRIGDLDIVLSSVREQTHGPEAFSEMGIDLAAKRLVVVKSAQHFYATFNPLAERIIYAVAPGATSVDFTTFDYQRLSRPIWPLDQGVTID